MTTPRERRQQRTRQAILDTAREIISEQGADQLSLREIARRIDYSPSGLYEYFGSKDEIVDAVCLEADGQLRAALAAVPEDLPVVEYLVEMGMAYIRYARMYPEQFLFLFMHRESDPGEQEFASPLMPTADDSFMLAYRAVQRGLDAGVLQAPSGATTMDITYGLWALVHGASVLQIKYLSNWDYDFTQADRAAVEAFIKGLLAV